MRKFYCATLFILAVVLASCSANKKEKPLPVNKMKVVVWDMMKADEWYTRTSQKDTLAKKNREDIRLYEQVFLLHHLTKAQFYASYQYYETHPKAFKELLDSVDAFAGRERLKLSANHTNAR